MTGEVFGLFDPEHPKRLCGGGFDWSIHGKTHGEAASFWVTEVLPVYRAKFFSQVGERIDCTVADAKLETVDIELHRYHPNQRLAFEVRIQSVQRDAISDITLSI